MSSISESPHLSRAQRVKRTLILAFKRTLTFLLSHVGLTCAVVGYVIFGGILFVAIEEPYELKQRLAAEKQRNNAVEKLKKLIMDSDFIPPQSDKNDTLTTSLPDTVTNITVSNLGNISESGVADLGTSSWSSAWITSTENPADHKSNITTGYPPRKVSRLGSKRKKTFPQRLDDILDRGPDKTRNGKQNSKYGTDREKLHETILAHLKKLSIQFQLTDSKQDFAIRQRGKNISEPRLETIPQERQFLANNRNTSVSSVVLQQTLKDQSSTVNSNSQNSSAQTNQEIEITQRRERKKQNNNRKLKQQQQQQQQNQQKAQQTEEGTPVPKKRKQDPKQKQNNKDKGKKPRPSLSPEQKFEKDLKMAVRTFEKKTWRLTALRSWDGLFEQTDEVQWSFTGAMLYSVTVVTTIGYGHLAPKTTVGRMVTVAYAIVGIPLTFLCVRNIGGLLSTVVTAVYRHAVVGLLMRWRLAKARMRRSRRISLIRDIMNDGARRLSTQLSRHWLAMDHRLLRDQELRKSLRRIQKERKRWSRKGWKKEASESPAEDEIDEEDKDKVEEDEGSLEHDCDKDGVDSRQGAAASHRVHWKQEDERSQSRRKRDYESHKPTREDRHSQDQTRRTSKDKSSTDDDDKIEDMDDQETTGSSENLRPTSDIPAKAPNRRSSLRDSTKSKKGDTGSEADEEGPEIEGSSKLIRSRSSIRRKSQKSKKDRKEELRRSAFLEEQEKVRRAFLEETRTAKTTPSRRSVKGKNNLVNRSASAANDDDVTDSSTERKRRTGWSAHLSSDSFSSSTSRLKITSTLGSESDVLPAEAQPSNCITGKHQATDVREAVEEVDLSQDDLSGTEVKEASCEEGEDDDPLSKPIDTSSVRVPIRVTLLIMTCYILGGAVMFTMWERDWDFLVGSYFCFITLSTIGFGDFVPGTSLDPSDAQGKWIMCCLYLLLGMAMQAMCFHLMQEEVRAKFRRLAARCGCGSASPTEEKATDTSDDDEEELIK